MRILLFFLLTALIAYSLCAYAHAHRKIVVLKAEALGVVDMNHANVSTLTTLKGIGKKRAHAIIEYRDTRGPFSSLDALSEVEGIGQKGLERMQKNNPGRITLLAE